MTFNILAEDDDFFEFPDRTPKTPLLEFTEKVWEDIPDDGHCNQ